MIGHSERRCCPGWQLEPPSRYTTVHRMCRKHTLHYQASLMSPKRCHGTTQEAARRRQRELEWQRVEERRKATTPSSVATQSPKSPSSRKLRAAVGAVIAVSDRGLAGAHSSPINRMTSPLAACARLPSAAELRATRSLRSPQGPMAAQSTPASPSPTQRTPSSRRLVPSDFAFSPTQRHGAAPPQVQTEETHADTSQAASLFDDDVYPPAVILDDLGNNAAGSPSAQSVGVQGSVWGDSTITPMSHAGRSAWTPLAKPAPAAAQSRAGADHEHARRRTPTSSPAAHPRRFASSRLNQRPATASSPALRRATSHSPQPETAESPLRRSPSAASVFSPTSAAHTDQLAATLASARDLRDVAATSPDMRRIASTSTSPLKLRLSTSPNSHSSPNLRSTSRSGGSSSVQRGPTWSNLSPGQRPLTAQGSRKLLSYRNMPSPIRVGNSSHGRSWRSPFQDAADGGSGPSSVQLTLPRVSTLGSVYTPE